MSLTMNKNFYRWVIVAAGGILGCIAIGAMFSLPVLLTAIGEETGWSRTGISAAMTIGFLAMAFGSMMWGVLVDKYGPRIVVMSGSVLLALSLAWLSRSSSLVEFQAVFGGIVGLAAAAIMAPMMATVMGWFDTQRSLAVSLVSAGMGMAPLTMSPLAAMLLPEHGWRGTLLIIAVFVAVTMIPVSLLVQRAPASQDAQAPAEGDAPDDGMSVSQAIRTPQFAILLMTNFFCCATHSGPIFHTVSYAMACGIPVLAAVSIYSLEGLAGMGGRIGFGLAGDKFGAKQVLVVGLLVQAFGALGYFFAGNLAQFYSVAVIFGFTYAGIMPLYSVLARENFPMSMMGTVIGAFGMAGGIGMATGPLFGGWIFDTTGDYGWLFIACFGMGIGAFLIAALFKPFPRREPAAQALPA